MWFSQAGQWLGLEACWVSHVLISGHRRHEGKLPCPLENLGTEGSPSPFGAASLFRHPRSWPGKTALWWVFICGGTWQVSEGAGPGHQTLSVQSSTGRSWRGPWSLSGQVQLLPVPVQELRPDHRQRGAELRVGTQVLHPRIKMTNKSRLHIPTGVFNVPL